MLDILYEYTSKWHLTVNVAKTKIVVFRNGGKLHTNEQWTYNGQLLDIVDSFTYLGVIFKYNCKFLETEKKLNKDKSAFIPCFLEQNICI